MSHDPGPWELEPLFPNKPKGPWWIHHRRQHIAENVGTDNARLIAAAPVMLSVILDTACPGGGWTGMPKELDISHGGTGAAVKDCLTYGVCGCTLGDAVKLATEPPK